MSKNIVEPLACEVLSVTMETPHEATFRVASDIEPKHGQFLQLSLPKIGEAPISVSAFGPGYLEFTIRAVGKVTDKLFSLQPGDKLFLRGAYGKGWPMDELMGENVVVIAGGTGLAAVRSILQLAASDSSAFKSMHLIAGFKSSHNILYRDELESWREVFNCLYTLDSEDAVGFEQGFVTEHLHRLPITDSGEAFQVLIIGPPVMMHHTALGCLKLGIPESNIWLSFERKMSCAVGKCGHCRVDEVYVCLEGPVFNYSFAKMLID